MAFDPDAYLAQGKGAAKKGFDPDAYLASPGPPGVVPAPIAVPRVAPDTQPAAQAPAAPAAPSATPPAPALKPKAAPNPVMPYNALDEAFPPLSEMGAVAAPDPNRAWWGQQKSVPRPMNVPAIVGEQAGSVATQSLGFLAQPVVGVMDIGRNLKSAAIKIAEGVAGKVAPEWLNRKRADAQAQPAEMRAAGSKGYQDFSEAALAGEDAHITQATETMAGAGLPVSIAYGLASGAWRTASMLLVSKGVMRALPGQATAGSDYVQRTLRHAAKFAAFTYVKTPGSHDEKLSAAATSMAYVSTPAISSGASRKSLAVLFDFALNSGISIHNEAYSGMFDGETWDNKSAREEFIRRASNQVVSDLLFALGTPSRVVRDAGAESAQSRRKRMEQFREVYGDRAEEVFEQHERARQMGDEARKAARAQEAQAQAKLRDLTARAKAGDQSAKDELARMTAGVAYGDVPPPERPASSAFPEQFPGTPRTDGSVVLAGEVRAPTISTPATEADVQAFARDEFRDDYLRVAGGDNVAALRMWKEDQAASASVTPSSIPPAQSASEALDPDHQTLIEDIANAGTSEGVAPPEIDEPTLAEQDKAYAAERYPIALAASKDGAWRSAMLAVDHAQRAGLPVDEVVQDLRDAGYDDQKIISFFRGRQGYGQLEAESAMSRLGSKEWVESQRQSPTPTQGAAPAPAADAGSLPGAGAPQESLAVSTRQEAPPSQNVETPKELVESPPTSQANTPPGGEAPTSPGAASEPAATLEVGSRIPWKNSPDPNEDVKEIEIVKLTPTVATVRWVGGTELQKLPRAAVEERLRGQSAPPAPAPTPKRKAKPPVAVAPDAGSETRGETKAPELMTPFRARTPKATTELQIGNQRDAFRISTPEGARISGYARNADFPGDKESSTRGELFYAEVPEAAQRKGTGTSLALDGIDLMFREGARTVNIHATSPAGRALIDSLIRKGVVSQPVRTSESGKAEYRILSVSAAAVDAYGIKLPPGYTRSGDRYVFRGDAAPAPETSGATEAETAAKPTKRKAKPPKAATVPDAQPASLGDEYFRRATRADDSAALDRLDAEQRKANAEDGTRFPTTERVTPDDTAKMDTEDLKDKMGILLSQIVEVAPKTPDDRDAMLRSLFSAYYAELKKRGALKAELPGVEAYIASAPAQRFASATISADAQPWQTPEGAVQATDDGGNIYTFRHFDKKYVAEAVAAEMRTAGATVEIEPWIAKGGKSKWTLSLKNVSEDFREQLDRIRAKQIELEGGAKKGRGAKRATPPKAAKEDAPAPATPKLKQTPRRRNTWRDYKSETGRTDVIDAIVNHGGIIAKSRVRNAKGEYDGAPSIGELRGFGPMVWGRGMQADVMAQTLYEEGILKAPDADLMWEAIRRNVEAYRSSANEPLAHDEELNRLLGATETDIERAKGKDGATIEIPFDVLASSPGALVWTGDGEWFMVKEGEDANEVQLVDGVTETIPRDVGMIFAGAIVQPDSPLYAKYKAEYDAQERAVRERELPAEQEAREAMEREQESQRMKAKPVAAATAPTAPAPSTPPADANPLLVGTQSVRPKVRGETAKPQVDQEDLLGGLKGAIAEGKKERAQVKMDFEAPPKPKPAPKKSDARLKSLMAELSKMERDTPDSVMGANGWPMSREMRSVYEMYSKEKLDTAEAIATATRNLETVVTRFRNRIQLAEERGTSLVAADMQAAMDEARAAALAETQIAVSLLKMLPNDPQNQWQRDTLDELNAQRARLNAIMFAFPEEYASKKKGKMRDEFSRTKSDYLKLLEDYRDAQARQVDMFAETPPKPAAKPDGYFNGDPYRLTGKRQTIAGGEFDEAVYLDGAKKGETLVVKAKEPTPPAPRATPPVAADAIVTALNAAAAEYGWRVEDNALYNRAGKKVHDIEVKGGRIRLLSKGKLYGTIPASKPENLGDYLEKTFYAKKGDMSPVIGAPAAAPSATRSDSEIAKWTDILAKYGEKGRDRLRGYLASLTLGRDFQEPVADYLERQGLTRFDAWAMEQLKKPVQESTPAAPSAPLFSDTYTGPRFTYGLRYRPMQIGAQPKGFIIQSEGPATERFRFGTIQYPRELTADELKSYEMELVSAPETNALAPEQDGVGPTVKTLTLSQRARLRPLVAQIIASFGYSEEYADTAIDARLRGEAIVQQVQSAVDAAIDSVSEEAPAPQPAAPREPWEMTYREVRAAVDDLSGLTGQEWRDSALVKALTPDSLEGRPDYFNLSKRHKAIIQDALAANLPVPDAVMADYPDLAKKVDVSQTAADADDIDTSPDPDMIPYTPSLKITNLDALPRGAGARYLEVIRGEGGALVAKKWRRSPVVREGVVLVDMEPPRFARRNSQKYSTERLAVDTGSLTPEVLARMDKIARREGYDSRGAKDVREYLVTGRTLKDGTKLTPAIQNGALRGDWAAFYREATAGADARIQKASDLRAARAAHTHVNRDRLRELGYTTDLREAGYITPTGQLIDLSGKREGYVGPPARNYDHREAGGTSGMLEFMAEGNIRINGNQGQIDMLAPPTEEQMRFVEEIIMQNPDLAFIDVADGLGTWSHVDQRYGESARRAVIQMQPGWNWRRLLNEIRAFYGMPRFARRDSGQSEPTPDGQDSLRRALSRRGVRGDALENAIDLASDLSDKGGRVTDDGKAVVYHRTTPASAESIIREQAMMGKENGLFFGTQPQGEIDGYGTAVVEVEIPLEKLELNDVFTGEAHVRMPTGAIGRKIPVIARETERGVVMLARRDSASTPTFYSALTRAIESLPDNTKMPGGQFLKRLEGLRNKGQAWKAQEAEESGLLDWLKMQQENGRAVTKTDALAFLDQNGVKIEEVRKGGEEDMEDISRRMFGKNFGNLTEQQSYAVRDEFQRQTDVQSPKFFTYAPPGGVPGTYREVLLTVPTVDDSQLERLREQALAAKRLGDEPAYLRLMERVAEEQKRFYGDQRKQSPYQSPHWSEPNVIAHMLMDERRIPLDVLAKTQPELAEQLKAQGKTEARALHMIEGQSDWNQRVSAEGYAPRDWERKWKEASAREDALRDQLNREQDRLISQEFGETADLTVILDADKNAILDAAKAKDARYSQLQNEFASAKESARTLNVSNKAPEPAFRGDAWKRLVVRKMLSEAVAGDYDLLTWSTGEDRFKKWGSQRVDWKAERPDGFESTITHTGSGDHAKWRVRNPMGELVAESLATQDEAMQMAQRLNREFREGKIWTVSAQEQHGGTHDGMDLEAMARERGVLLESKGQTVRTKEDLRRVIESIKRGDETNVEKLTDRIWDRMQAEAEGTSLPRKEFFEFLYDQSFRNEASAIVKKMDKAAGVADVGIAGVNKQTYGTFGGTDVRVDEQGEFARIVDVATGSTLRQGDRNDILRMVDSKKRTRGETMPVHAIPITDAIRSAVAQGQPYYARSDADRALDTPAPKAQTTPQQTTDARRRIDDARRQAHERNAQTSTEPDANSQQRARGIPRPVGAPRQLPLRGTGAGISRDGQDREREASRLARKASRYDQDWLTLEHDESFRATPTGKAVIADADANNVPVIFFRKGSDGSSAVTLDGVIMVSTEESTETIWRCFDHEMAHLRDTSEIMDLVDVDSDAAQEFGRMYERDTGKALDAEGLRDEIASDLAAGRVVQTSADGKTTVNLLDAVRDGGAAVEAVEAYYGGEGGAATQRGVLQAKNATVTAPGAASPRYMVKAYHGTPHTFEPEPGAPLGRVKKEKVGTGEGAAAYGWGVLYTAEQKDVADQYRESLSKVTRFDGKAYDKTNPRHVAASFLADYGDRQAAMTAAQDRQWEKHGTPEGAFWKKTWRVLWDHKESSRTVESAGNLYHVELAFDPEDCLDWDRAIEAQPAKVKKVIAAPTTKVYLNAWKSGGNDLESGQDVYHAIANRVGSPQRASEYLASFGVRGIQYADQGSRSNNFKVEKGLGGRWWVTDRLRNEITDFNTEAEARDFVLKSNGGPTFNYVVFSESDIRVVGRNGEMMSPSDAMGDARMARRNRRDADAGPDAEADGANRGRQGVVRTTSPRSDADTSAGERDSAAGDNERGDSRTGDGRNARRTGPRRIPPPLPIPPSPDRAAATIPAAVAARGVPPVASSDAWANLQSFEEFVDAIEASARAHEEARIAAAIRITQAVERGAVRAQLSDARDHLANTHRERMRALKAQWRTDKATLAEREKQLRAYIVKHLPPDERGKALTILGNAALPKDRKAAERTFLRAIAKVDTIAARVEKLAARADVETLIQEEVVRLKKYQGKTAPRRLLVENRLMQDYINMLTIAQPVDAAKLDKALNWFALHPDQEIPDDIKKTIAEQSRPTLDGMDAVQLRKVAQNIRDIRKVGFLKWRRNQARERIDRKEQATKIARMIYEGTGVIPKRTTDRAIANTMNRATMTRAGHVGKAFWWGHWRPEHILEWFDGYQDALHEAVWTPMQQAEYAEFNGKDEAAKRLDAIFGGLRVGRAMSKHAVANIELAAGDGQSAESIPINMDILMFIYAHSQNETGRAHLVGTEIPQSEVDRLSELIQAEHPLYAQAVNDFIDWMDNEQWDRLNDEFVKEHQVDMGKEDRYFPVKDLDAAFVETEMYREMAARLSNKPAAVSKGFTKGRVNSKAAFRSMSFFKTAMRHVLDTEHYIAFNTPIREANALLRDPALKTAMNARSEEARQQVDHWLKAVALGRLEASRNPIDKVSDFLRTNFVTSALGFNLVTMLKQVASFAQGSRLINATDTMRTTAEFTMRPLGMIRDVMDKSVMMRHRAASIEREIAEINAKGESGRLLGATRGVQTLRELSMKPIQGADRITTTILWMAKYREKLAATGDEAQSVDAADRLIRTTQPQGGLMHLPEVYRGGGIARAYTMFTNQLNQNWNLSMRMFTDYRGIASTAADIGMFWVLPSLLIYLMSTGMQMPGPDDDEGQKKFLKGWARAFASNIFGGLFGVNRLVDAGMMAATGDKTGGRFVSDLAPASLQGIQDIIAGVARNKPMTLLEGAMQTAGLPYLQPKRTIKGFDNFQKTGDPRYLIWSPYALGHEDGKVPSPVPSMSPYRPAGMPRPAIRPMRQQHAMPRPMRQQQESQRQE